MEFLEIISWLATILSTVISVYALFKVRALTVIINQKIKGNNNKNAGGDFIDNSKN